MTCLRLALCCGMPVLSPCVGVGSADGLWWLVFALVVHCGLRLHHSFAFGLGVFSQVGIALKPFLPQLQTTFTKALQDSNRGVRLKAADALGKLISIHIKVDPLFTELLNGIRVMEDPGVR